MEQYPIDELVLMDQAQIRDGKVLKMVKRYLNQRYEGEMADWLIIELVALYRDQT